MRKIMVVTGSRADYGLLYWTLKRIQKDPSFKLQLMVTGMHLSRRFGQTVNVIQADGFPIAERVSILSNHDDERATGVATGMAMTKFAKLFSRYKPDVLLALGDRFEIFAAVAAAIPFRIPVAHIHGGETTEGAIDEVFRHAMTKMSYWHLTTLPAYSRRIIQMGESPNRVFCVGAPGLDLVSKTAYLSRPELAKQLRLPEDKPWGVVTFHPVTLEYRSSEVQILQLLKALSRFKNMFWVFTCPNADTDHQIIIRHIRSFVRQHPGSAAVFSSLGGRRYLSLLKTASIMVGNSSSGIIEAPSFRLPVVNIGDRQKGRERAGNVIDIPAGSAAGLEAAVRRALSASFRRRIKNLKNPYRRGDASQQIVNVLKHLVIPEELKKRFHDGPVRRHR